MSWLSAQRIAALAVMGATWLAAPAVEAQDPGQPDLVIQAFFVAAFDHPISPGDPIRIGAVVLNAGDAASAATTLRYYRSDDATITTADTAVVTEAVDGLAAAATSTHDVERTALAGTYYYAACVDAVAGESDTTNNCSHAFEIEVAEPQTGPDLVVGSPSVSDDSLLVGAAFTLSATVENAGDGASAATTLRYYRSTDAAITSSDAELGTGAVEGLSAGATSDQAVDLTAPASGGTYYYGACVDAVAGESDTTNNCSGSVQVTVSAPPPPPPPPPPPSNPDLVVGAPSVTDTSLDAGDSFTLSTTVRNDGDGASAATTLRYYRSTDAAITNSDTEVGTDAVEGLSAGATSDQAVDLTAPSSGGTYYYGACVDAVAGESDTTNNCSGSVQVTVSAPPPPPPPSNPDLVVGAPSVTDTSLDAGDSFTLSATVRNDGDGASAATTLRYYRSTDTAITSSDTEVGTDAVEGLSTGTTSDQSVNLTAPSSGGTYYYGACVDAVAGESDTTNNCSGSVQVTVSAPPPPSNPDLVVGAPSVSDTSLDAGDSFTLSTTVENAGDGDAAATTLRYYRSTDAAITNSDTEVGAGAVEGLSAGATSDQAVDLTAPAAGGTYYYGACVDAVGGESDTTNNCSGSVQVTVSPPPPPSNPDLVVGAPSVSDTSLDAGDSFTLSTTVENAGDGDAAATTLRYYRSTDAAITNSDTEVGAGAVEGLSAGATSDQSVDLTAPAAGTYFYGACVDAVAGESDTTNNCSGSVQVTVSAPPPPPSNPDLVVGAPSVSDTSLDAGDSFTLSATVRERRGRRRGRHDAAVLPVDGRGDYELRHRGGHRRRRGALRRRDQRPVGGPDGAGGGGDLLLRGVRGRGGGGIRQAARLGFRRTTARAAFRAGHGMPPPPPPSNPDLVVGAPSVSDTSLDAGT